MLTTDTCNSEARCYVTRTSLKCVAPGLLYGPGSFPAANGLHDKRWDQGDDTRVCFQYSAIDSAPVGSKAYKTNDQLYEQLEGDLKAYGAQAVEVRLSTRPYHDLDSSLNVLTMAWTHVCI